MPHDALARRLVVVRGDGEHRVAAELRGLVREVHRVGGVVAAGVGDDLRPVADLLDRELEQRDLLGSVSVEASPVVPATARPSVPWPTRWCMRFAKDPSSTRRSASNGVTIAVMMSPNTRGIVQGGPAAATARSGRMPPCGWTGSATRPIPGSATSSACGTATPVPAATARRRAGACRCSPSRGAWSPSGRWRRVAARGVPPGRAPAG